jgi:release factor glutamine methyltransferase
VHKVKNVIALGSELLRNQNISNPNLESRLLLQHILQCNLEELLSSMENQVEQKDFESFQTLINRRANAEPLAYIAGKKEFFSLNLEVCEDVLIPRSDSEILVEAVLKEHTKTPNISILDLGTGSGALSIALSTNLPKAKIMAVDLSQKALAIAEKNAIKHEVNQQIEFIESNWFTNVPQQQFDVIISNPPYISAEEKVHMSEEVFFEPFLALFAENDGLKSYQEIAKNAGGYLKPGGSIYLEIGFKQKTAVTQIFEARGFTFCNAYKDLQQHDRCIKLTYRE